LTASSSSAFLFHGSYTCPVVVILKLGDIFEDKYRIEAVLGDGGISVVYRALQTDCGRTVALKILHLDTAMDEDFRDRFVREAQLLCKLRHVNIVNVYCLGISAQHIPFIVMEHVRGKSLRTVLDGSCPMSVARALKIIAEAARALYYVHQQGIVHRDLKLENILLTQVPETDTVKIVDFGFAAVPGLLDARLTATGVVLGTPAYMSPEQCMGSVVDFRADVYALTVCLYELMVGKKPFESSSAVGLMYKHIKEPVPAIKLGEVDQFHPAFNELIRRGMAKNPEERFTGMEEMAGQIDSALDLVQCSSSRGIRTNAGRRLAIAASLGVVILICSTLWYVCKFNGLGRQDRTGAATDSTKPRNNSGKSSHGSMGRLAIIEQQEEKRLEKELANYQHQRNASSLGLADCMTKLGWLYYKHSKFEKAEPLLRRSLELREKRFGSADLDVANTLDGLAYTYLALHRSDAQTEKLFKRSLAIRERLRGNEHSDIADSLANLANLYRLQFKLREAELLFRRSLKMREKIGGKDSASASCRVSLAEVLRSEGKNLEAEQVLKESGTGSYLVTVRLSWLLCTEDRFAEAEKLALHAIDLVEQEPAPQRAGLAECLDTLSGIYSEQGRYPEAEKLAKRLLSMREMELGPEHQDVALSLNHMTELFLREGKYADAELLGKRALAIVEKAMGMKNMGICDSLEYLALVYEKEGKTAEAQKLLERSLTLRKSLLGENSPALCFDLLELSRTHRLRGNLPEAEKLALCALALEIKAYGPDHSYVAEYIDELSAVSCAQGNYSRAETLAKKSLAIREKSLGSAHHTCADSLDALSQAYYAAGEPQKAEQAARKSLEIREKALGPDHPAVALSLDMLAKLCQHEGRISEAERLAKRSAILRNPCPPARHRSGCGT
jgi:serine/threonine protein kinase